METRPLGSLAVSTVGLGCNAFGRRLDEAGSREVVRAALDAGITHFDTADSYSAGVSEEHLGRALGDRRDDVVIVTKFGRPMPDGSGGASPAHARRSVEASLRRLGTDHLDVCLVHVPDPDVPIADTLGALGELVGAGLVREVGCSNFSVAQLAEARSAGPPTFAVVQDEYSLVHRQPEADLLPDCAASGTAFVPYFPLGAGVLTGKYRLGEEPPVGARLADATPRTATFLDEGRLRTADRLRPLAERAGVPMATLAVAWLLTRPAVASVIAGATSPAQVAENAAAADADLTGLLDELDGASAGHAPRG